MPIHVHLAAFPLSCRGSGRAKATQLARSVYHFSGLDVEAGVGFGGHDDSSHGRLRASNFSCPSNEIMERMPLMIVWFWVTTLCFTADIIVTFDTGLTVSGRPCTSLSDCPAT